MDASAIIANAKAKLKSKANQQEGSFAADVVQACAVEIAKYYSYSDIIMQNLFVGSATGKFLDLKASDYGLVRKPASKAKGTLTLTGTNGLNVPKGSIFSSNEMQYQSNEDVTLSAEGAEVAAECTVYGVAGNAKAGTITTTKINGLTSVTNAKDFTGGGETETDEAFRERLLNKIRTPATSGNIHHYKNWALEVVGVGRARVIPLHAGAGTVKVLILSSEMQAADEELISKVKAHIGADDTGSGKAPIGATVTVASGTLKAVNVSVDVEEQGYTLEEVKSKLEHNLKTYLKSLAFNEQAQGVSYAKISDIVFNTEGVKDYQNLTVNGGTANIALEIQEFPSLGTLEVV